MTHRTRNFVIASLLVVSAGVGSGLVAYYGFPTSAFTAAGGPDELKYLPSNATLVAFADVHEVMTSELRQRLHTQMPFHGDGQRSFQNETGINIETDIDRLVFGLTPSLDAGTQAAGSGLVIARGRFDVVQIERAMRDRGATVDDYKGKRVVSVSRRAPSQSDANSSPQPLESPSTSPAESLAVAFVEPGLVAVGSPALVRRAIDLKDGGDSVMANEALMSRVHALGTGNVWAVGRFDALTAQANLAKGMVGQLPAIAWFSANGQVDSGISATVKAETRDEESANGLRDVVRGFVALARMQMSSRPDLQPLLQSLQLGGTGQVVTISVDVTPQMLDSLSALLTKPARLKP